MQGKMSVPQPIRLVQIEQDGHLHATVEMEAGGPVLNLKKMLQEGLLPMTELLDLDSMLPNLEATIPSYLQ